MKLWDAATGQEIRTFRGHSNLVMDVAFRPNGRQIASGSLDNTVKLWDPATGKEVFTFRGHTQGVASVAFSMDGRSSHPAVIKPRDFGMSKRARKY